MKKAILVLAALALVPLTAHAVKGKGGGSSGGGSSGTMSVQVREVIVRSTPNYLGGAAGKLAYGAQVTVAGEEGNWFRITSPSGYVPKSALTSHKVDVNPDQKFSGRGASHDEVALAGKGFNPQVEAQYKKDNASLAAAYVKVDQIEGFGASEAELKKFQAAGKLSPR